MQEMVGNDPSVRCIEGIPVKNIWFLMYYASEMFRHAGKSKIQLEEYSDRLPDLIGEMLAEKIYRRLQSGLTISYIEREEILSRVRGKINFLHTEGHQLFQRGKVCCQYQDLNVDTPRNRFVRSALDALPALVSNSVLSKRCSSLARTLRVMGVVGSAPSKKEIASDRISRHEVEDKGMMDAAMLVFDFQLLSEERGEQSLFSPCENADYIKSLFKKALSGFYQSSLLDTGWEASTDTQYQWPVQGLLADNGTLIDDMGCDIVLHHKARGEYYIIDVKFKKLLTERGSVSQTDIYPLYALLKTQTDSGISAEKIRGILMRPGVGEATDEAVVIQGHEIRLCSIDLTASAHKIRQQLLSQVTFR